MLEIITQSIYLILGYATFWFAISLIAKRNDIADIAWGLGYILLAAWYWYAFPTSSRSFLLFLLIFFWGMRLAIHVYTRNKGKKEDYRYKQWRDEWGSWFYIRSFLQVYILQGTLLLLVISPLMIVSSYEQQALRLLDCIGLGIWIIGFYFETIGDYQLRQFKKDPNNNGKILTTGLWKYTRHPNYFGEVTMWWGIFFIALNSPYGWWAIIGPATITSLILFVSGIPMLEKRYEGNKEFETYKKKTSAFIPLPPK